MGRFLLLGSCTLAARAQVLLTTQCSSHRSLFGSLHPNFPLLPAKPGRSGRKRPLERKSSLSSLHASSPNTCQPLGVCISWELQEGVTLCCSSKAGIAECFGAAV